MTARGGEWAEFHHIRKMLSGGEAPHALPDFTDATLNGLFRVEFIFLQTVQCRDLLRLCQRWRTFTIN